ncbi:uncharacterized protein LOC111075162 [Drosophila obscura]|uniref:uncharacterized protein LOC111075162 n=1 Tax=Drosophila obscura TaxID=7282 RepID=UPI001BB2AF0E|nr:uncharacterized protein LOC111075162 [Drosophila obscura]
MPAVSWFFCSKLIMGFDHTLQRILQNLRISDGERSNYTEDAVEIQNYVIEKLKSADSSFREAFDGLSLAGSYLDRVKLKTPDEFDLHMKLKLPFPIIPKKDEKGFVFLCANNYKHPILANNYVDRKNLQAWLRDAFNEVFTSNLRLRCSTGEVYEVRYTAKGYGCAHTIEAEGRSRTIWFDLVPAFEFTWAQWPLDVPPISTEVRSKWPWFAVPQSKRGSWDERTFIVCAPHWERETTRNLNNFKNVLRLMKGLRDAHESDLPHLSSYMLKTVLLHQLGRVDWNENLHTLFVKMWSCLVNHLKFGNLDFFLANGNNIFDRMQHGELEKCRVAAVRLMSNLNQAETQIWMLDRIFKV